MILVFTDDKCEAHLGDPSPFAVLKSRVDELEIVFYVVVVLFRFEGWIQVHIAIMHFGI